MLSLLISASVRLLIADYTRRLEPPDTALRIPHCRVPRSPMRVFERREDFDAGAGRKRVLVGDADHHL